MENSRRDAHGPEHLRVYWLAQELAGAVDAFLRGHRVSDSLGDQLVRESESIILNIAEGASHFSPGKKLYHYQLARGSAGECIGALTRIHRRYPTSEVREVRRSANMISIMMTALIRTQEKRKE